MNYAACATVKDGCPGWRVGREPLQTIEAWSPVEVVPALNELEAAAAAGGWGAGFVTYEAAAGLGQGLAVRHTRRLPLVHFDIFKRCEFQAGLEAGGGFEAREAWTPNISFAEYEAAIAAIKELIAAGETYQVNFTLRLRGAVHGCARGFFEKLNALQPSSCGAFLDCGTFAVCSASPELFFELNGKHIFARPMKGTRPRNADPAADRQLLNQLVSSEKDKAENTMIVDMMRNDIGRIAEFGSVRVSGLFAIEPYPTVFQMTSTVEGKTKASLPQIFGALFPCASVTGAPKHRTMKIIRDLENEPRGVYTGAIGWVGPGRQARFNVGIRTVLLNKITGSAEYGLGSGVIWDSSAELEFAECLDKAAILSDCGGLRMGASPDMRKVFPSHLVGEGRLGGKWNAE
jgi:para-aminobenzoate synthetase/4-amino-4-deoxychorismate lyase